MPRSDPFDERYATEGAEGSCYRPVLLIRLTFRSFVAIRAVKGREELKALADERDVPYRSLLKIFLAERIARERRPPRGAKRTFNSSPTP